MEAESSLNAVESPREDQIPEKIGRRGISGSTLKLIAIVTMFIDHIGAVILERGILLPVLADGYVPAHMAGWYWLDLAFRQIGRAAFPIFCFLLVEGFFNTRDRKRYALRLGAFCLLSDIPFDLAFSGVLFDWKMQNVFFTLTIGFCVIWAMESFRGKNWKRWQEWTASLLAVAAGAALANVLHTDYAAFGVLFLVLFYIFRSGQEWRRNVACGLACAWEITAPLALIPIHLYNKKRGLSLKYAFYLFYPVHLLLLTLVVRLAFGV